MITPDVNLLIHAYNTASPSHAQAREWWEGLLNDRTATVGLTWVAVMGFVRIVTHPKVLASPLEPRLACRYARTWLSRGNVSILQPGPRHAQIFFGLLESLGTAGNLTTDAHLASIAIEFQAELHTTDADMSRFSGLSWRNPLR